jgi:nicotinamidase-related amidase
MSLTSNHADFESYKASGFSGRMGWGQRPALLLIDACKAYWCTGSPLDTSSNPASVESVEVMKRLLAAARESKVPIIWTQVLYKKGMKDAGLFYNKSRLLNVWEEGNTKGYDELVPGLEPAEGEEIVVKRHPSAFFGTELASQLHLMNVDTLVICGVSTSGCVRASTLDAMCYNYRPMVRMLNCLGLLCIRTDIVVGRRHSLRRSQSCDSRCKPL